jgi:hypothetical protein
MGGWRAAFKWGFGVAVVSRLALLVWMAAVWLLIGQTWNIPVYLHADPIAHLPALDSPLEQAVFGVWRRWDGSHYLNLAQNGYQLNNPGPTVFAPLTPVGIRVADVLVPGALDLGAMVFATLTYAFALVMLYRVCEVYYKDADLGKWSILTLALLPLAFFFSAPMSESIYLGMVLGVFYAGARGRWLLVAIFGALATLARSQGLVLAGVAGLMLLQDSFQQCPSWPQRARYLILKGWPLLLIPFAFAGFLAYRQSLGLPPLSDTYYTYSYNFFTNPLEGTLINLRWIIEHPGDAVFNPDSWALVISVVLCLVVFRDPRQRRLPLIAYTLVSIILFISRINWAWGGHDLVLNTQSFGRYSLTLFPLTVWLADWLRRAAPRVRLATITLSGLGLLIFSALFVLGGGAP